MVRHDEHLGGPYFHIKEINKKISLRFTITCDPHLTHSLTTQTHNGAE